jgi:translation initiation factor IF-2
MPKIRLNKAVKEFNISMSRLVEFLQSKDFVVENNPNAQLEEAAYSALEAEFAKDGEQRKASHEVVISKVPEEKLEIEEKKTPEVIRAKANKPETKILGKIDLEPKKPEAAEEKPAAVAEEKAVEPEAKKEEVKEIKEEKSEPAAVATPEKAAPEKQEFKVLDKIDLSQIEGRRPSRKEKPKTEEPKAATPKVEEKTQTPVAETEKPAQKQEEKVEAKPVAQEEAPESQKIETVYQKLAQARKRNARESKNRELRDRVELLSRDKTVRQDKPVRDRTVRKVRVVRDKTVRVARLVALVEIVLVIIRTVRQAQRVDLKKVREEQMFVRVREQCL